MSTLLVWQVHFRGPPVQNLYVCFFHLFSIFVLLHKVAILISMLYISTIDMSLFCKKKLKKKSHWFLKSWVLKRIWLGTERAALYFHVLHLYLYSYLYLYFYLHLYLYLIKSFLANENSLTPEKLSNSESLT